jgi:sugar phosphate isomerase/epimerase
MSLPVALQLYSVRNEFAADLGGTLKEVKEMGYDGVELAGFAKHSPAEVKAALDEAGLKCISAHVPFDAIKNDPKGTFETYKSVGCEYVSIPWLAGDIAPGGEKFNEILPLIKEFGQIAKDMGLVLLYHNHDFEFRKVGDKYGLDVLFEEVPADLLQTQIDCCWVKMVGIDPAGYIRQYNGRAPIVHIKDFTVSGKLSSVPYDLIGAEAQAKKEERGTFMFKPVGSGMQDVPSILQASLDVGAKWVVVEYDQSPEYPTLETAKISREYLKTQGW